MTKVGIGIQGSGRYSHELALLNPDAILFMQDGLQEIRWLRSVGWAGEAWFRFYDGNSMGDSPENYAERVYEWLAYNDDVGITDVTLWNELNLGVEHGNSTVRWDTPEAYAAINDWCFRCLTQFRLLTNEYRVHWGAISPGHDGMAGPESEYDLLWQSLLVADMVDMHVYGAVFDRWAGSGRAVSIATKLNCSSLGIPTDRLCITETNQVDYIELCKWLKRELPDLDAVVWFLWAGNPEHAAFDLVKQDLELLRAFIKENIEEEEMGFVEQYPQEYAQWVAAGGAENNFRKHMLAINKTLPVSWDDVKLAVNEAEAAAMQAKLILARYVPLA